MAATDLLRRAGALLGRLLGIAGGIGAVGAAKAIELPANRADLMYHRYDGGGTVADGPALLVRKSLLDRFSLSASYYMDAVSNASIDVLTTASPYKETRHEYGLGVDYTVRDAMISLSASHSEEPDYVARAVNVDVAQEFYGGMSTLALGVTRGSDDVGTRDAGFFDTAKHWRYRLGLTQILTPRWLLAVNAEAVSDAGFLGSPYRSARVFGAAIPERNPRTRTSRAVKLRAIGAPAWLGEGRSLRAEYRYYWDTWDVKAHTFEAAYTRRISDQWLADAYGRYYTQDRALFYSDNASSETQYITRNRMLATFDSIGIGAKLAYTWRRVPGRYEIRLNGAVERAHYDFKDFTDPRSGQPYSYDANIIQLFVSASF